MKGVISDIFSIFFDLMVFVLSMFGLATIAILCVYGMWLVIDFII